MRKCPVFLLFVVIFSGVVGCSTVPTTVATASNVTYPVLVGPVKTIKGQPRAEDNGMMSTKHFDERVSDIHKNFTLFLPIFAGGMILPIANTYSTDFSERKGKLDVKLLKMMEENSEDKIMVDEIYFGAYNGGSWLIGFSIDKEWVGIKGALYNSNIK